MQTSDHELFLQLIEYARFNWLISGSGNRLHCGKIMTPDIAEWRFRDVTFECGRTAKEAFIPGVFSRMELERCDGCCAKAKMPRGTGSPKNDKTCRMVLGLTTAHTSPVTRAGPRSDRR